MPRKIARARLAARLVALAVAGCNAAPRNVPAPIVDASARNTDVSKCVKHASSISPSRSQPSPNRPPGATGSRVGDPFLEGASAGVAEGLSTLAFGRPFNAAAFVDCMRDHGFCWDGKAWARPGAARVEDPTWTGQNECLAICLDRWEECRQQSAEDAQPAAQCDRPVQQCIEAMGYDWRAVGSKVSRMLALKQAQKDACAKAEEAGYGPGDSEYERVRAPYGIEIERLLQEPMLP
jgi:hypothetical protein